MGGGLVFWLGTGQAFHRVPLLLRDPRWLVTSGLCCTGYLLREIQVVREGKSAGTLLGPTPSSRQMFSGPNTRESLWGLGAAHRDITSAQLTNSFIHDLESKAIRDERDASACHVDLAE